MAADLAIPVEPATPDESLLDAICKMDVGGAGTLPVVDLASGKLCGLISRAHILAVYDRALAAGVEPEAGGVVVARGRRARAGGASR